MEPQAIPLVSVVVPTFDRPAYLRAALAGAVAQTYENLEIIVHDNASPGDPSPIVESFGDPRIKFYRNARNLGMTANIKAACLKAHGKYVAILGDDDLWQPDLVATLVRPLEADADVIVAFCDHVVIDENGRLDDAATEEATKRFQRRFLREGTYRPFDRIALVHRSICVVSAALLRREAIDWQAIPVEMGMGLDLYLCYLAARTGKGCYYCPRRLAQYRFHARSASSTLKTVDTRIGCARDALFYWNQFLGDGAVGRYRRYFEMKRGFNALVIVISLLRCGDGREAVRELRQFLRDGLIPPRIFFYHLIYALRLHRVTA